MFLDARQLQSDTALDAELCIVGAGAAGISLAMALRDAGFRTLLLESGGLDLEEDTQALYAGDMRGVPNHAMDASRLRMFGGSTNCWAGWCRPLEPTDFAHPAGIDLLDWPLRRSELDPYYARAQTLCELGPYDYDDLAPWLAAAGDPPLPLDARKLRTALFQVSPPSRFGLLYHDTLAAADNVRVVLHANVLGFETDAIGQRVTMVRARPLHGAGFTVRARVFVLATGGLENARLLLLSDDVQTAGLGNGHDLVGRYFMDHLLLSNAAFVAFPAPVPQLRFHLGFSEIRGTTAIGMLATGTPERGIGGFRIWLRPTFRIVEGVDSLKALGHAAASFTWPEDGLWHHLSRVLGDYDAVADAAWKSLFHARKGIFNSPQSGDGPAVGANLDVNWEQMPNRDSRVLLSDRRDALGQRRLVMDWRPTGADKRTLRRAVELAAQEFGRLGLGRVRARDIGADDSWPFDLEGSRHPMGTTRMAADPRQGVVDANCRVHGVANLYVAGSSVFPTGGYANPTLTIVALALRLADELKRVLA